MVGSHQKWVRYPAIKKKKKKIKSILLYLLFYKTTVAITLKNCIVPRMNCPTHTNTYESNSVSKVNSAVVVMTLKFLAYIITE